MANRTATSLIELLSAVTVFSVLCTIGIPRVQHGLNALKARSAREAVFGMATRARTLALERGGAQFIIDIRQRSTAVVAADGVEVARTSLAEFDVDVATDGVAPARIVLQYDAHGIGRMASRTIRFRRGDAETGVTFSSYGRVRRW